MVGCAPRGFWFAGRGPAFHGVGERPERGFLRLSQSTARIRGREGLWGHVLVALSACVLTVSIVGSIVYLSFRAYDRLANRHRVRAFVSALQNRTDDELDDVTRQLLEKPQLARYVLPEILKSIRNRSSERQQVAAIRISQAFLDKNRIRTALFELATDPRETVAGAAVESLAQIEPPERAADFLGKCLALAPSGTVVDEACLGLLRLGEVGRIEASQQLSALSTERRVWLVGFVTELGGEHREPWLRMLMDDGDERVRTAAAEALTVVVSGDSNDPIVQANNRPGPADK